jgi:hypothetical protein
MTCQICFRLALCQWRHDLIQIDSSTRAMVNSNPLSFHVLIPTHSHLGSKSVVISRMEFKNNTLQKIYHCIIFLYFATRNNFFTFSLDMSRHREMRVMFQQVQ